MRRSFLTAGPLLAACVAACSSTHPLVDGEATALEPLDATAESAACDRSVCPSPPQGDAGSETGLSSWEATVWINHYSQPCSGPEGKYTCDLTADSREGPWQFDYNGILGIELRWGHVYQVVVQTRAFADSPPDGPAVVVQASEVLVDEVVPAATAFRLPVDPNQADLGLPATLSMHDANTGHVLQGPNFTCVAPEVCKAISSMLAGDEMFEVEFRYAEDLRSLVALEAELR